MYAPYKPSKVDDIPRPIKRTNFCPFEPFGPMHKVHGNFPTYNPVYMMNYNLETSYNEYHKPMDTTPVAYNTPPADEPDEPPIQTPAVATPNELAQALAKKVYGPEKKKMAEPEPLWSDEGLLTFILFLVLVYIIIVIASSKKF